MRALTEKDAETLTAQLLWAADELREHAAQHLYRADAAKAMGERVLAGYHQRRAASVHDLATTLKSARAVLAQRTSPLPRTAVPRPRSAAIANTDTRT